MLHSAWLIYLVEVYSATNLKKKFYQQIIYFLRTGKTIQQIFSGNTKRKKQMHSMDLVGAFSTQRFSFCGFCDLTESLKIGVVIDKEKPFYLLLPPPLNCILICIFTWILAIQVWGHTLAIGGLLSSSAFSVWFVVLEGPYTLGYFWIWTLFSVEILSLRLNILDYAEQKIFEYLDQNLTLSYPCCISTQFSPCLSWWVFTPFSLSSFFIVWNFPFLCPSPTTNFSPLPKNKQKAKHLRPLCLEFFSLSWVHSIP